MRSNVRDHAGWAMGAILTVLALLIIAAARPSTLLIDRSLPPLAAVIALCGWWSRRSPLSGGIAALLPLLVATAAIPSIPFRMAAAGVVFTAAVALLTLSVACDGLVASRDAVAVSLLMLMPFRLIGASRTETVGSALVIAGVILLIVALSSGRSIPMASLLLLLGVGAAAPSIPSKAALFPLILGLAVWFLRSGAVAAAAGAAGLSLAAGRWALLIVGLAGAARLTARLTKAREEPSVVAVGAKGGGWFIVARTILFSPTVLVSGLRPGHRAARLAAVLLLAAAIFLRPALSSMYSLSALVALSIDEEGGAMPVPSAVFVMLIAGLLPWSGAVQGTFPLPLTISALLAIALIAAVPSTLGSLRIAGPVAAALFFFLAAMLVGRDAKVETTRAALAPGQSFRLDRKGDERRLDLVLSGANLTALPPGSELGRLEIVDADGQGYSRRLQIGDLSDWAAVRPGSFFTTHHALADRPLLRLEGAGTTAFAYGGSVVPVELPAPIRAVRLVASSKLSPEARLYVEEVRGEKKP